MSNVPFADPWFWAFLAAIGWGLAVGAVGTQTPGLKPRDKAFASGFRWSCLPRDPGTDVGFEGLHALVGAAADHLIGQEPEPPFH